MNRIYKALLTAVAVAVALQVSWAQEGAIDQDRRAGRSAEVMDRVVERMSEDLELDDSQKEKFSQVLAVGAESRAVMADRFDRTRGRSEERNQQRQELTEMLESENFDVDYILERAQERQAKVDEMRVNIVEAQKAVLTTFAEFHATLNEEQREKLTLIAARSGVPGIGRPDFSRGGLGFGRGPGANSNRGSDSRGFRDQGFRDGARSRLRSGS